MRDLQSQLYSPGGSTNISVDVCHFPSLLVQHTVKLPINAKGSPITAGWGAFVVLVAVAVLVVFVVVLVVVTEVVVVLLT